MPFMDLYTERGDWWIIDGDSGQTVVPVHVETDRTKLLPYYDGTLIFDVERQTGWCARYSAAGYTDCADWCGPYETEQEAIDECRALYGAEEEDEEEETA